MPRIEIDIPDEVTADVDHLELTVDGPEGTVTRRLWYPNITVSVEDGTVTVESDEENTKTTATMGTFESHIANMLQGVTENWEYRMEVFYSHFPMQVRSEGDEVVIENFLGERAPRRTTVHGDTEVEVNGEELVLTGPDKEAVGQTAADIEQMTRVNDKDTRVFQDGVYITEKPQKGGV